MPKARPIGLVVLVVGAAAIGLSLWQARLTPTAPDLDDPELIALGAQVYAENCASCHGADLEGEVADWRQRKPSGRLPAPPHDETGHTWHHPSEMLFALTKFGVEPFAPDGYESDMPAYAELLTDRQIWGSIAYIRSHWPAEIQQRQAALSEP
jgi:mono/diheme cytochrome c family protein